MDSALFDQLVKSFGTAASRRSVLGRLAVLGVVGAGAMPAVSAAQNKNRNKRKNTRKNKHKKRKQQDQRHGQGKADAERCIALNRRCRKHGEPCCDGAKCRSLLGLPLLSGKCRCPQGTRACAGACTMEDACCAEDSTGACPPCDVCADGCPFTSVQAAIDAATAGSTITLCAGAYSETVSIGKDITVTGLGDGADPANNTLLDGAGAGSVVTIAAGAVVTLQSLRITGGNAELGGGIHNDHGTLTLDGCTVSGNAAADSGGGICNRGGTLTLSTSTVSGNSGDFGGGIDNENGTLDLAGSSVSGNTARIGGGLFIDGPSTATLSDSTVSDNTSQQEGGGIATDDDVVTLTLTNCTVHDNTSGLAGGGIFNVGDLAVTESTVRDNTANDDGGGIRNATLGTLTLESSSVTNNHAVADGGGIANAGTVSCSGDSNVSGNSAGSAGTENCFDELTGSGCATCPA